MVEAFNSAGSEKNKIEQICAPDHW